MLCFFFCQITNLIYLNRPGNIKLKGVVKYWETDVIVVHWMCILICFCLLVDRCRILRFACSVYHANLCLYQLGRKIE